MIRGNDTFNKVTTPTGAAITGSDEPCKHWPTSTSQTATAMAKLSEKEAITASATDLPGEALHELQATPEAKVAAGADPSCHVPA